MVRCQLAQVARTPGEAAAVQMVKQWHGKLARYAKGGRNLRHCHARPASQMRRQFLPGLGNRRGMKVDLLALGAVNRTHQHAPAQQAVDPGRRHRIGQQFPGGRRRQPGCGKVLLQGTVIPWLPINLPRLQDRAPRRGGASPRRREQRLHA